MGAELPSGTVTFLFTDIEGSTRLWEGQRAAMEAAVARHDQLLGGLIEDHGGYVFTTAGDAFADFGPVEIPVRIGLHSGEADERGGDYFGPTLNRAASGRGQADGRA